MNDRTDTVLKALAAGKITAQEADFFLIRECGITLQQAQEAKAREASAGRTAQHAAEPAPHFTKRRMIAYALLIILAASLFTYLSPGLSGLVVLDIEQQNATNTTITIDQPVVGINISGVLYGEGTGTVYFDTPDQTYIVAQLTSDPGLPRTDKPAYAPGEAISIEHAPENATYYFDDGTASTPIDLPLNASTGGTILIVTPSETYRLPVIIGEAQRAAAFLEECMESCQLTETAGSLRIETTGSAVVQLDSIQAAVLADNTPPQLTTPLGPLTINETTTVDLAQHFSDAEGDTILYSVGSSDFVNASSDGSILQLIPVQTGSGTLTIYVSDLTELVPHTIEVNVQAPTTAPEETNTTETTNTTPIVQNETAPPAANATVTPNATLDCTGTNPNLLPEECLLQNASDYFVEQDIFWENGAREQRARFTIIGNLLITGDITEQDAGAPSESDFQLGYLDRDLNSISTVWIDNAGNLHLRGSLHEENANLNPPAGAYTIGTRRGIYVAYVDLTTGDLYLRGNVIPYRRSLE